MAKVIKSDKGFKLIEMSSSEVIDFGGFGICDDCNRFSQKGVYVAVLNQWMCSDCFNKWHSRAVNYPEDKQTEQKNFDAYKNILKLHGHEVMEAKERIVGSEEPITTTEEFLAEMMYDFELCAKPQEEDLDKLSNFCEKILAFGYDKSDRTTKYGWSVKDAHSEHIYQSEIKMIKRNSVAKKGTTDRDICWVDQKNQCAYTICLERPSYVGQKDKVIVTKKYFKTSRVAPRTKSA